MRILGIDPGLARVAQAVPMPLCAGENDYSRLGFARLIAQAGIRIAMPDLQRVGGNIKRRVCVV